MKRFSIPIAIAAACFVATAVSADQYVAKVDTPFSGANAKLLAAMKIAELDIFDHDGATYIVLEAPNEDYVEAYFFALHIAPVELNLLEADWTALNLSGLSIEQRLPFLRPADCGFCMS